MAGVGIVRWLSVLALVVAGCDDPCARDAAGRVCPLAGTGQWGYNRDGLDPERSDLYLPSAVRRGPDGLVYIMDFNNQRLRVIDADGHLQTVVGNGFHALAVEGVDATDSPLENPIDFAFLPDGRLIFTSYHDPRVLVIDGGQLVRVAGTFEVGLRGFEGDHDSPLVAQFIQLDGIAVTPDGTIYLSDSLANRVRVIEGDIIHTVAGDGREEYAGDGGPATEAALFWPTALELDVDGGLFIADTYNHVVRKLHPDGTITTVAGTGGVAGFAGDGGPATGAMLDQPYGLAVEPDGTMYIADRGNHRIRRVAPDGTIDTIAGTGQDGHSGDGGAAVSADFGFIARIALDGDQLLVADQSNACARRVILR